MRFTSPHSRLRVLLLALALLAVVPTIASAAPKKVRFSFPSTTASVNENGGTYTLRINRSGNTRVAASVHLAVTGTAVAGTNYTFTNPVTVSFAAGETSKTFPVSIIDNTTFDPPNKTIIFTMSGASPGGSMITVLRCVTPVVDLTPTRNLPGSRTFTFQVMGLPASTARVSSPPLRSSPAGSTSVSF